MKNSSSYYDFETWSYIQDKSWKKLINQNICNDKIKSKHDWNVKYTDKVFGSKKSKYSIIGI